MTRLRGTWTAAVAVTLFLLTACARADGSPGGAASGSPASSGATPASADALVLRIERVGGFVAPDQMLGRLPLISIYADGRMITEGAHTMIYPGAALPSLLVQQLDPATVAALPGRATAAGVRPGADLGQPNVADAPTTRITVAAAGGTRTLDAVALTEAQPNDPRLTEPQRAARASIAAFVRQVTDLTASALPSAPYRPVAVVALAQPYNRPQTTVPSASSSLGGQPNQPAPVAWPGPALPGAMVSGTTGCVTADGEQGRAVLAAAAKANQITPWSSGGKQWSVLFRPLLPDETGCAALRGAR